MLPKCDSDGRWHGDRELLSCGGDSNGDADGNTAARNSDANTNGNSSTDADTDSPTNTHTNANPGCAGTGRELLDPHASGRGR